MKSLNAFGVCAAAVWMAGCAWGQNAVTDWAVIVQPAVNTPPRSSDRSVDVCDRWIAAAAAACS